MPVQSFGNKWGSRNKDMTETPKTQKQSTELILYRLDELSRTSTAQFIEINRKLDTQPKDYVLRTEFDAFKKSIKVNYVGIAVITGLVITIIYHLFRIRP